MENSLKRICDGDTNKSEVIGQGVTMYRDVFYEAVRNANKIARVLIIAT
jgi:DNA topoisomerase IA